MDEYYLSKVYRAFLLFFCGVLCGFVVAAAIEKGFRSESQIRIDAIQNCIAQEFTRDECLRIVLDE